MIQCHAEGGVTKGGVSKCEQTQTNASKRRGANASKREQMWTNANKRLPKGPSRTKNSMG